MSTTPSRASDGETLNTSQDLNSPTYASFSPASLSHVPTSTRQRSSILVHQKSPLLVATPPQITRALAYSHPFLLPLNKLAGLLSWTSGDAWESFLLLALFWAVVIYGDLVIRWGAPLVVVAALILGMYSRRYSPLSSTGRPGGKSKMSKKKKRSSSADEGPERHQKSLDEIVETLNAFTARCNVLLEPLLRLTDFLSTQQSATSATTRPALTTLFIRILMLSPIWLFLTLSPLRLVTTRAVVLAVGTVLISWHSRPARVSRAILWRSMLVRQLCSTVTGLSFGDAAPPPSFTDPNCEPPSLPSRSPSYNKATASIDTKLGPGSTGVRFTFILYENQRRWIGLGWTQSLFAYERAAWSDERLNPAPTKDDFELPEVEGGNARWRWIDGSEWRVEGAVEGEEGGAKGVKNAKGTGGGGWIYYDNKWRDGRRNQDSWGRYTRRRKWYRDAELVEVTETTPRPSLDGDEATASVSETSTAVEGAPESSPVAKDDEPASSTRKRKWFRSGPKNSSRGSNQSAEPSSAVEEDEHSSLRLQRERDGDWGLGDDAEMGLS